MSSKDPEVNQMLIFPKDFKEFEQKYPDSLKWIQTQLE